jgi:NAD(P)-dependent dehydrogenase (short-subunit alcohol dehydrogenase family)
MLASARLRIVVDRGADDIRYRLRSIKRGARSLYDYNSYMSINSSPASTRQLSDTRVLVTGGTSGLGRAMAQALALAGARVAVSSRRLERARATTAELGAEALAVELDVRDPDSVSTALDTVYEAFDGLDMLVNNAGIGMLTVNPKFMTEPQPLWEVPPDGFRDVLETKATGTFLVTREVVPRMLRAGGGRVVTISMNEQTMTRRGFVPYGPSGAAVEALARVLAADLADTPVTANMLLPGGATATGMLPDEMRDELREQLLDPAIMGPPIVWLASADAAAVHDERIIARDFEGWLEAREEKDLSARR